MALRAHNTPLHPMPHTLVRVRAVAWCSFKEEFTFKGFGLTVSKSLMARDVGVGFGIPLTPNFQVPLNGPSSTHWIHSYVHAY